jgi:flagellar motor switch protein FliM
MAEFLSKEEIDALLNVAEEVNLNKEEKETKVKVNLELSEVSDQDLKKFIISLSKHKFIKKSFMGI